MSVLKGIIPKEDALLLGGYPTKIFEAVDIPDRGKERRMRPIDADAIKLPKGFFEEVDNVPKFYEWLNELPTIEPKRGKWYDWSFKAFDGCTVWHRACSVCGYKRDDDNLDKDTPFCPYCGAQMERSEE